MEPGNPHSKHCFQQDTDLELTSLDVLVPREATVATSAGISTPVKAGVGVPANTPTGPRGSAARVENTRPKGSLSGSPPKGSALASVKPFEGSSKQRFESVKDVHTKSHSRLPTPSSKHDLAQRPGPYISLANVMEKKAEDGGFLNSYVSEYQTIHAHVMKTYPDRTPGNWGLWKVHMLLWDRFCQ